MTGQKYSAYFVAVVAVFITSLIVANIIAVKLVSIGGLILPAAVIIFPISYIAGDVLTEVYGFRHARQAIWLGFVCNLLAVIVIWAAQALPGAAFWDGQAAYERILGFTPRLLAASFTAYLIGGFANAATLAWMKRLTNGRWLWSRTIGSTIVGEGLDSLVFITVAFWSMIPLSEMVTAIVTQWLFKVGYEAIATPITYMVVGWLKRKEGMDEVERGMEVHAAPLIH